MGWDVGVGRSGGGGKGGMAVNSHGYYMVGILLPVRYKRQRKGDNVGLGYKYAEQCFFFYLFFLLLVFISSFLLCCARRAPKTLIDDGMDAVFVIFVWRSFPCLRSRYRLAVKEDVFFFIEAESRGRTGDGGEGGRCSPKCINDE